MSLSLKFLFTMEKLGIMFDLEFSLNKEIIKIGVDLLLQSTIIHVLYMQ
jgi:hypothetical protein